VCVCVCVCVYVGKASELAETIWRRSSAYIGGHGFFFLNFFCSI
jgi:hypothetical protein